jgi:predicted membrane protein
VDFSLEALDFIHRLYQSEESVKILGALISLKLFMSLVMMQILLGMLVPLVILIVVEWGKFNEDMRKMLYFTSIILIQLGIFCTRWNVVIGGQLFSKSFRGLMTYKMEVTGLEGLMTALGLLVLPFIILAVLVNLLPTRRLEETAAVG